MRYEKLEQRNGGHTIGAVVNSLREEFPDLSISKMRFLEDEKLLPVRRAVLTVKFVPPLDCLLFLSSHLWESYART